MDIQKKQMHEAAMLYYKKEYTQNEIANIMKLSRQTVSKLLRDALKEKIVDIKINNPEVSCKEFEEELCKRLKIKRVIVCGVSNDNEFLRLLITVRQAAEYIKFITQEGNQKIGISWGRTVQMLISEFPVCNTMGNIVFPLFGATEQEQSYYMSNELARSFADKICAKAKYAWFPYRPDSTSDCELFRKTTYYKSLSELWKDIDIAIVGIGNQKIIQTFVNIFGYNEKCTYAIGDVSTHFFDEKGNILRLYENTLCASKENIISAKQTIAVACGNDKAKAIVGAARTQMVDTLITDEYTAKNILYVLDRTTSK